ncbi:hypothetical protein [Nostoc sp. DSM 114161]|uniref:hypothetical protein n=1 Tax=Nostoc sp. DSM 114161 TaxID=3440143 RepID=UPI00404663F8
MKTKASPRGEGKTSQNQENRIATTFWGRDWRSPAPKPTNGRLQDSGSIPDDSTDQTNLGL